jgi:diketogulonate reductase-like aldo/keto reductase
MGNFFGETDSNNNTSGDGSINSNSITSTAGRRGPLLRSPLCCQPSMSACIELANGVFMPRMALGTFCMKGEVCSEAVSTALSAGFRHIDTATCYRNEEAVAEGLRRSGLPRSDIFITSKLSPKEQGYDEAVSALEGSLARLGTSYVDLYLIHWPGAAKTPHASHANSELRTASWRALQDMYSRGLCRAVGVSNYGVEHLQELLALPAPSVLLLPPPSPAGEMPEEQAQPALREAPRSPMVNQFEAHPLLPQVPLREFFSHHDIRVSAYSSFGQGQLLDHPAITAACEAAGHAPVPDTLLRWALQSGMCVIPKSVSRKHIEANLACMKKQELPVGLMDALNKISQEGTVLRTAWDPTTIS